MPDAPLTVEIGQWYELIHYEADPNAPDGCGAERHATLVKPLSDAQCARYQVAADKGGLRLARVMEG